MSNKTTQAKGRPISNKIDRILANPKGLAKAIFKAPKIKKIEKKPN